MGGGSSDAATTLLALNRLWGLGWPRRAPGCPIGAAAGRRRAVLPGRAATRSSRASANGSRRWRCRRCSYAVVKPPAAIATRDIFEQPRLGRDTEAVILAGSLDEAGRIGAPAGWTQGFGKNDLQPARRGPVPRGGASCPLARGTLRQQPDDGLGQRGVLEGRCRRATRGDMPGARMNFRRAGWGDCAAAWPSTRWWGGPAETGVQRWRWQAASCVGESPSWLRHRILIPTCEGSSPSSPAKSLP